VPIVVISGSTTGQGARRSLELGANAFIQKPTDSEALVREVNRLLEPTAPPS
jgi:FixJ family two-component response regulator